MVPEFYLVVPGLVGIHVFLRCGKQNADGRDKPGHDEREVTVYSHRFLRLKLLRFLKLLRWSPAPPR